MRLITNAYKFIVNNSPDNLNFIAIEAMLKSTLGD